MMSQLKRCDDGLLPERWPLLNHPEENDSTYTGKTQRIRLFPTKEEKLKLRRWVGTAGWTYNRCLVAIEIEGTERSKKSTASKMSQRNERFT